MSRPLSNVDPALPLTPTAEVHTRADRTALERRRVLSDLIGAAQDGEVP
jgi:hypothetical protein